MLLGRSAEGAVIGVKADHVEAADQADILFASHVSLLEDRFSLLNRKGNGIDQKGQRAR
jgi:hypothetical protein